MFHLDRELKRYLAQTCSADCDLLYSTFVLPKQPFRVGNEYVYAGLAAENVLGSSVTISSSLILADAQSHK
jgi:hypothetical protein